MKTLRAAALAASFLCAIPGSALASSTPAQNLNQCGFLEEAPIFGMGTPAGTAATPILQPLEQGIVSRGDKSEHLRNVPVPATNIDGWTSDYAMMRLSQLAGKPIWALTEDGSPGDVISLQVPPSSLAHAFDMIAEHKGKRWRYDGEKVYLLGGREWSMPLPASRDVALAVRDALTKHDVDVTYEGHRIRFQADNDGVAKISAIVSQVYAQDRLNPYDVKFYRVYPTKGQIDWATLIERTDAIETVSFEGKGATVVLDPTAGAVVDAFLAREGRVDVLGSATMVAGKSGDGSSHAAGCGNAVMGARGIELAGGAFERGRVGLSYSILGSANQQAGKLAVVPGSVVVIADAEPEQGAYMVAVVRPRILELQGPTQMAAR